VTETCTIVRRIEFDAGHRVPMHDGKCRNPHGHRYVVEAHITGPVAVDGMVLDFGIIKQRMVETIHDPLDHKFIVAATDHEMLRDLADWPLVVLPYPPTAENLAHWCFYQLDAVLADPFRVGRMVVWETPNGRAEYVGQST
jgi:6-pyruvoyltetrahydropterin/6-carboxytetrahydropterin synthase